MIPFREWIIPELLKIDNHNFRWTVFQHAVSRSRFQWWFLAGTLAILLTVMMRPGPLKLLRAQGDVIYALTTIGGVAFAQLANTALGFVLFRRGIRRAARVCMQRHYGIAICGPCGYDLTGNTNGICPECGETLRAPSGRKQI